MKKFTLKRAFDFLCENDPGFDGVLHVDHICAEAIAHDIDHCAESEVYTAADAAVDSLGDFAARLGFC